MDKKITVFKLPADGSLKAIPEEIPDKLEVLQQYVDGYIEIVTLERYPDGSRSVMIVNDSGFVWGLPYNGVASVVYFERCDAETPIAGNAIICGADAEGELTDIRPAWGLYLIGVSHTLRVAKEEGKI